MSEDFPANNKPDDQPNNRAYKNRMHNPTIYLIYINKYVYKIIGNFNKKG